MKIHFNKMLSPLKFASKVILMGGLSLTLNANAQLANGNYTFSNAEYVLKFTIEENGWTIKNTVLSTKSSGLVENQTGGELMKQGPAVWYQFQTGSCNYEFDEPKNTLKLSRFDCKDKSLKKANINLKKN